MNRNNRAAELPIYKAKPSIIFCSRPDVDCQQALVSNVLDSTQQQNTPATKTL